MALFYPHFFAQDFSENSVARGRAGGSYAMHFVHLSEPTAGLLRGASDPKRWLWMDVSLTVPRVANFIGNLTQESGFAAFRTTGRGSYLDFAPHQFGGMNMHKTAME